MKGLLVLPSKLSFFSRFKLHYFLWHSRFQQSDYFDLFVFVRNLFLFLLVHPRDLLAFLGICFLSIFKNFSVFITVLVFLSAFLFFVGFLSSLLI